MQRLFFTSLAIMVSMAIAGPAAAQYGGQTQWNEPAPTYRPLPSTQTQPWHQPSRLPGMQQPANTMLQQPANNMRPITTRAGYPLYGSAPANNSPIYGTYQPPIPRQDDVAPGPVGQQQPTPAYDNAPTPNIHTPNVPTHGNFNCPPNAGAVSGGTFGGAVSGGTFGGGAAYGGCATGNCGVGGAAAHSIPSYFHGSRARNTNWFVGLRGLIFTREYEDDLGLSYIGTRGGFSTDADLNNFGGFEAFVGGRHCSGWGWQLGYWGLYPERADTTFGPTPLTALGGLSALDFPLTGQDVQAIYNSADNHRYYRTNEFHNFEANFLRNAGCINGLCCNAINLELLAGFRYFRFREDFRYGTFTTNPLYPAQLFYDLETENDLIGFQLGCRSEYCLTKRFRFSLGTKLGIYDNQIYSRQSIHDDSGNFAQITGGPYAGTTYAFASRKHDVAFLGEFDLGLIYQISCCWRLAVGYRAVVASGVALAPDQVPFNFTDPREINRINSNGCLVLHGAYAGLEFCF